MISNLSFSFLPQNKLRSKSSQGPGNDGVCSSIALRSYSKLMTLESVGWQMI
jgi:hypothetical protein